MALTPEDVETQVFRERFRGYDEAEVDVFLDRIAARMREQIAEQAALREELREALSHAGDDQAREEALGQRDTALQEREAALHERDAALHDRQAALNERDAALSELDTALEDRDAALAAAETSSAEAAAARRQFEEVRAALQQAREENAALRSRPLAQADGGETERLLKRTLLTAQRTADETIAAAEAEADQLLRDARARIGAAHNQVQREAQRIARAATALQRFRSEYHDRVAGFLADQLALLERAGDIPELPAVVAELTAIADDQSPPSEVRAVTASGDD